MLRACAFVRKAARSRSILLDTKVAMKCAKRRQISHETAKIAMRARARKAVVRRRFSSNFFFFFSASLIFLSPLSRLIAHLTYERPLTKANSIENGYKIRGVRKRTNL